MSVDLVLSTGEVPLIVGESGIGKTALAKELARKNQWSLVVIDGNLLKEGEIGGLPTIETHAVMNENGEPVEKKTTVYAVHHKLREIDQEILQGNTVLLFIDEINRCEHTVQQELMNLILNREINGYQLPAQVKIIAAMNPSGKYGSDFDYQVVDMDAAQENRFVWLYMEPDYLQWLDWADVAGIDRKVIEFISTFPEYLHRMNEDHIWATPRSYERISKAYQAYQEKKASIPRAVFLNVLRGNVGKMIAEEFLHFVEADYSPLISYEDVFQGPSIPSWVIDRIPNESHTRLYLSARNILKSLELRIKDSSDPSQTKKKYTELEANINSNPGASDAVDRMIEFLRLYPVDLRIGIMKDMKSSYPSLYQHAIEKEAFVELYFEAYTSNNE
jgi:hypothetical protein